MVTLWKTLIIDLEIEYCDGDVETTGVLDNYFDIDPDNSDGIAHNR